MLRCISCCCHKTVLTSKLPSPTPTGLVPVSRINMSSGNVEFWKLGKKIAGAGLNYKALCAERNLPLPKEPVIFLKPTSSYIVEGQAIEIPGQFVVYEEVELGVVIGKTCRNVKPENAMDYVAGYCLALDLTATNFLEDARSKGLPWSLGKGFDTACPVSRFVPKEAVPRPDDVRLWCRVNGVLRQDASTWDMIFPTAALVSYVSRFMTLEPHDLVLTGSSKGVCRIEPGDTVQAGLADTLTVSFDVKAAPPF